MSSSPPSQSAPQAQSVPQVFADAQEPELPQTNGAAEDVLGDPLLEDHLEKQFGDEDESAKTNSTAVAHASDSPEARTVEKNGKSTGPVARWKDFVYPPPDDGTFPAPTDGNAFLLTEAPQPHPIRAKQLLRDHPEVRKLFGINFWSGVAIAGIVSAQIAIAVLLSVFDAPWWAFVITAYVVGAYANHALWVLVHECCHNLVFRKPFWNRVLAIVANFPMALPCTVPFCIWHLKHHRYLGDTNHDADVAPPYEAWFLRGGFVRRLLWQCFFPLFQTLRTLFLEHEGKPASWVNWRLPNTIAQAAFVGLMIWLAGPWTFVYFMLCAIFAIGPHPLGARWIQEHYVFRKGQETYSYYGKLNTVAFNIGYHNEHHDLPQIPWNRLPRLKRMAPEKYDPLYAHYSWVKLWLRFLFDRNLEVFRMARER